MRRWLFGCLAIFLLTPSIAWAATDTYATAPMEFKSAIVLDAATGKPLYEYKSTMKWSAASLTKLMGALVFLDRTPNWTKVVKITKQDEVGGGRLRVNVGASMTVRDLFYSSITASANNAAMALARVSGLSRTAFVAKMNAKAKALGMTQTTFVDPSGMDANNKTTAKDMSKLALAAFRKPDIRKSATATHYTFVVRNTGQVKDIKTTNQLLREDDIVVTGGKTGFLYESMYNLAVRVKPADSAPQGRELLIVVLGAPTQSGSFASAKSLANWVWDRYDRVP